MGIWGGLELIGVCAGCRVTVWGMGGSPGQDREGPWPSQEKDRLWFPALGVALCTQLPPGHSPGLNRLADR